MKVFIGWSGETSKEVASILKVWLSQMNAHIETFMPSKDVGLYWYDKILREMNGADAALLCVTRENLNSPWLYYETGFLMGMNVKYMAPILCDVTPSQVSGPLRAFQFVTMEQDSLRRVTYELNQLCGENQRPSDDLNRVFDGVYPTVEKLLKEALDSRKEIPAEDIGNAAELKRDIIAVNSKLDAILSRLDVSRRN